MIDSLLIELFKKLEIYKTNELIIEIKESTNNQVFSYGNFIGKISDNPKNLKTEYEVLQKLENKGKFPKPFYYGEIKKDNHVLIMEKLPGRGLQYSWNELLDTQREGIVDEIISHLKIIHNLSGEQQGDYFCYLETEGSKMYEVCKGNPDISKFELNQVYADFCLKSKSLQGVTKDCIIHNDLWYKNVLVQNGQLTGIIDFETSISAPKQIELFKLLHHRYSAQNYIDDGAEDYTEISFLDLLLKTLEVKYGELFDFKPEQYQCYNLFVYMRILSKYKESWYSYEDVKKYQATFLNKI